MKEFEQRINNAKPRKRKSTKNSKDESYYENLEIFLKEFEKRINNAKSKKIF